MSHGARLDTAGGALAGAGHERDAWGLGPGVALGIALGGFDDGDAWQRARAWAERADALGLHSLWVPEMHFAPGASSSPLHALSAFGARTRRLRLGTTSLLLPIHEPEALAREIAALDHQCDGRLILGLGRGFRRALFDAFGVDAASKRDRFDAVLDRMLEIWKGEAAPRQQPTPPLAVAAFGPKGLAQAARRGLPYLASPLEPDGAVLANLERHRCDLPPGRAPVVPVMRSVYVAADEEEAARMRRALAAEWSAPRRRVPAALARAAEAPLEERSWVGTREAIAERLTRFRAASGMDLLIVRPPAGRQAGIGDDNAWRSTERLAEICAAAAAPAS